MQTTKVADKVLENKFGKTITKSRDGRWSCREGLRATLRWRVVRQRACMELNKRLASRTGSIRGHVNATIDCMAECVASRGGSVSSTWLQQINFGIGYPVLLYMLFK